MSGFGACILDAEGLRLTREERRLFADADPFGFILFARNVDSPDQLRALCAEMRDSVGREAPILVDQEGGRVQRLRPPHWRDWPAPLAHAAAAGADAAEAMRLRSRIIASELRDAGIDANCAPVADIAGADTHPFLRDRCYGGDCDSVARIARAAAQGLLEGGVLPVLKHVPGHGRAAADSHEELPRVAAGREELAETDFAPFRALNDLPMAMTAHVVYSRLDERPATTSPVVMDLVRGEIGFDGLVMTDDISMKALSGPLCGIARESLEAGCDAVLLCNATLAERAEVAEAAGRMGPAAQARAERALAARRTPEEIDVAGLEAKLAALTGGQSDG